MNVRTSTRFRRDRAAVPAARAFVKHAIRSAGASAEASDRLVLAVAEACNNAVLHADGPVFTVGVVVDDGWAEVTVVDTGPGLVPSEAVPMPGPYATGRRGLALMRAMADDVQVTSDATGTSVVLGLALTAPTRYAPLVADR